MNLTHTLGWTLLHFLWQGAAIALLMAVANRALSNATARCRYAIACSAMLLMFLCAVTTLVWISPAPQGDNLVARHLLPNMTAPGLAVPVVTAPPVFGLSAYMPWFVYFWFAGVTVLAIRSLGGWVALHQFKKRQGNHADTTWQWQIMRLAERFQIARPITLCESGLSGVPATIGWLRPVILFPASALTGLTPEQIETLLVHELAHIRRHDYLINLLQTAVETLFFYHPAVWWVSRKIREERENCCDDLAVEVCGDPLAYARALMQLEQLRGILPQLAMAAKRGSLRTRIERLLPSVGTKPASSPDWILGASLALVVLTGVLVPRAFSRVPQDLAPRQADFIDNLEKVGYRNLTVDQLISLKVHDVEPDFIRAIQNGGYRATVDELVSLRIHGVTPEYISEIQKAGWKPTLDELISFRIHGVELETVNQMRALGYNLGPDEAVNMQIHGLTPAITREMKQLGFGDPTFDQLISLQIHGVDAAFANGWKASGVRDLTFEKLIDLSIHGADVAELRELEALGFKNLSVDNVLDLRIHDVTSGFIREAVKHGFDGLNIDKIIQLKELGIFDTPEKD